MSKSKFKALISLLLVFSMMFMLSLPQAFAATNEELQNQIDENNKKIEELRKQQASQAEILAAFEKQDKLYESQLSGLNGQVDSLTKKINAKTAEITAMQEKIKALEDEMAKINTQIDEQNKQIDVTYDLLSERLRAMYVAGNTSDLEVLLSSTDFSEFLTRTELLRRVSEHDTALVKDLEVKIKELNKMAADLEAKKDEQQKQKAKLDDEKYDLVVSRADLQDKVDSVQKTADKIEAQRKANADKLKNLVDMEAYYVRQNEIADAAILANSNNNSHGDGKPTGSNFTNSYGYKVSSKGFICPLQYSDVYVSAGYPYYPSGRSHTGMDFCCRSGTLNKNVRAAAGGTVTVAVKQTNSYGYHIEIDHGNGITTLYGHASELLVSVGQHVNQGQIIMRAGSTGNSTGPHVHFSVIIGGQYVNPANYVNLP